MIRILFLDPYLTVQYLDGDPFSLQVGWLRVSDDRQALELII